MPVINFLTRCFFDHGAIENLNKILAGSNVSRPMVITDPGIKAVGLLDTVLLNLGMDPAAVFTETVANPTEDQAIQVAQLYKDSNADGLVALGGGSAMDLTKAVGLLASHGGPLEKYAAITGGAKDIGKLPPLIAVPTTAGTGSEVSVGMITTMNNGRKETFASPHLIPATAICDPDLTLGLPAFMTAATGMDAVTHCIEAVLTPVTRIVDAGLRAPFRTDEMMRRLTWRLVADAAHELYETPQIEDAFRKPLEVTRFVARRHMNREEDRAAQPVPIGRIAIPLSADMQARMAKHDGFDAPGRPKFQKSLSV